jgi:hypothetical protein
MEKTFNFVNLKHPDELKDEETQSRIRRLAMTEVAKARRRPKTRREKTEFALEFHNPQHREARSQFDSFYGSIPDPFESFPVDLDESSRALVVGSEHPTACNLMYLTQNSLPFQQQPRHPVARGLVASRTQVCVSFQCGISQRSTIH